MKRLIIHALAAVLLAVSPALAQDGKKKGPSAEEMARLLQNPLASIAALMTDNTINFGQGTGDDTGYDFQLQPVYAVPTKLGFTFIPRAVIPIVGAPPGSDFPKLGSPRPPGGGTVWGLSDIITQFFFAPDTEGGLKWGGGPMVSWRTRTDRRVGGPGWGGGIVGIVVYNVGNWSFAGIFGNLWGQDGFNTLMIQPMIYYNIEALPGAYVAYNNSITADWSATSSNRWSVPLGLTVGRAYDMGGGYGLDLSVGAYGLVAKPTGGPDWQFKFGVTVLFPR